MFTFRAEYLECRNVDSIGRVIFVIVSIQRSLGITVNSYQCYKTLKPDSNINKHNLYDTAQSEYLNNIKSTCSVDRNTYLIDMANNSETENTCNKKKCNITKDMNTIQGYTTGYDLYINDKVKKGCNHNPKDARVIAC